MRMIEELFDGNIQPCERPIRDGSPLQKLASLVMKNNDALLALLDEAQWARFERYKEIQNELAAQLEREAFTEGFCIGARLTFEVMEHTEIPSIDD